MNAVDVLVQPVCLRFRLQGDEVVYLVAADPVAQLDGMDAMLGVDPAHDALFDANLGFLPVATTTLIRGELTIVVDPGNHHIGFYGLLGTALRRFGLSPEDVDVVVCTHCHHDHMGSAAVFRGRPLVLGEREAEVAAELYGREETEARIAAMGEFLEVPLGGELELAPGVSVVSTPGHTPGHVSVLVEAGDERVVVAGDAVMVQAEYRRRAFSHWYTAEQLQDVTTSVDRLEAWGPTLVLPGHDRAFRPSP